MFSWTFSFSFPPLISNHGDSFITAVHHLVHHHHVFSSCSFCFCQAMFMYASVLLHTVTPFYLFVLMYIKYLYPVFSSSSSCYKAWLRVEKYNICVNVTVEMWMSGDVSWDGWFCWKMNGAKKISRNGEMIIWTF